MSNPDPQHDADNSENERADDDLLREEDDARRLEDAQAVAQEQRRSTECAGCVALGIDPPNAVGERFIWRREGNHYYREARCDDCVNALYLDSPSSEIPHRSVLDRYYTDTPLPDCGIAHKSKDRK